MPWVCLNKCVRSHIHSMLTCRKLFTPLLETALGLEKDVNKSLLNLHAVAANSTDPELEHQLK